MTTLASSFDPQATRAARHAMVASQLRTNAVSDERVITAMASIGREAFLPPEAGAIAYRDTPIPLGGGRYLNPPLATGRLLTEAALERTDRVLLIGAAGGYAAAVLAGMVARVTAVESDPALIAIARRVLAAAPSVDLIEGPLAEGHAAGAPYDLLVVDGAVEALPAFLLDQLRPGARIVSGLVERGVLRLAAGVKTANGVGLHAFVDSDCVVLPGFAHPTGFRF